MKKLFFFCAALLALSAQAEEITLNLYTATDAYGAGIEYNTENIMDSTYSEDYAYMFIYTNDADIMLSHLISGNSWGGTSWDGFTLSKKNTDTGNQFECVAKGGLEGEGTPFVVGYYSEYYANNNTDGYTTSNFIEFSEDYYPKEVYICQSSNTLKALKEGLSVARPFTDKDTLALIITGINKQYEEVGESVVYYLAVDGKFNQNWDKVDLSSIGLCRGISFRMTSTDKGQWGINTPTYFALDGLTISTEKVETGIQNVETSVKATKRLVNGELLIERNGNRYNAAGQLRK